MRPRQLRRRLLLWGAACVVVGALLGTGIAVAAADPSTVEEWAFIATLDAQGITYASPDQAVAGGMAVCSYRDLGFSEMSTVLMVERNSGLSPFDAGYLVGAAEAAFCPWYSSAAGVDGVERPRISDGIGGMLI